jgi:succinoglycan biosynthesis transport protein ExoP
MNIKEFLQVLRKNIFYLLFFPLLLAVGVYFMVKDKPMEYKSTTLLYTGVVSGYNLNSAEGNRIDYNAIANAFDNLTSISKLRDVSEETSVKLLAKHLMNRKGQSDFNEKLYLGARNAIGTDLADKLTNNSSYDKTASNIYTQLKTVPDGAVAKLLESGHPYYGVGSIQNRIQAFRKSSSDIIEITFSSFDPTVCQNTLEILSETIIEKYKAIKTTETHNVVAYFEERAAAAKRDLQASENKIIEFGVQNKIINYDEQSKSIAVSKTTLLEDIESEKMVLSSATASLNTLNKKLNMRNGLLESNSNVMAKRKRLSELNYKISNAEIHGSTADLSKERAEAELLRNEIKELVGDIYEHHNTQEGIHGSTLLTQWLNNLLIIDESNSRIAILNSRLKEFDKLYSDFAPMGSQLASLQREVSIAEREYLDILHSLNESNLRQQNIAHSSNLKVIEPPSYPSAPNAMKNKLLVLASFLFGFIVLVAFFLIRELTDGSIKTPARAEQYTGLKVAGTFPLKQQKKSSVDLVKLEGELIEQTLSAVLIRLQANDSVSQQILISSIRPDEGKTWCALKLANKLSEKYNVALCSYKPLDKEATNEIQRSVTFIEYQAGNELPPMGQYRYVIVEVPPLTEKQIPLSLLKSSNLPILILNAERSWNDIDVQLVDLLKKASSQEPVVFLNKISIDKLETILGTVPKLTKKTAVKMSESLTFGKEADWNKAAKEV